jgi:putative ABC transport system permease protein
MVMNIGDNAVAVPEIGDVLKLKDDNGTARDFEVIGIVDRYPHHLSARYYLGNSLTAILADNVFLDFFGEVQPMQTNINVGAENVEAFESWLNGYAANQNPDLSFISRNTLKAEFEDMQTTYMILGGAMSFILALIGVMNFINAVVASIITRRRELAMLQSVGMTGKQIIGTLLFEGVCYTSLTALFTLTAGFGLIWLIVKVMAGQAWFFKQNLTVMPSVFSLVPLFLICAVVPLVCYVKLNRDSLVERLRVE